MRSRTTVHNTRMTEADFQQRIIDTAILCGWRVAHQRPGMNRRGGWSTAVQGDRGAPDLLLARAGQVLLAEIKSDRGRLGPGQGEWLTELGGHGRLWRPSDWTAVLAELKGER
jgi:hypothetical protein